MSFFSPKPKAAEPFFTWTPAEHSVGISRFDEDHKQLAKLVTRLHAALIERRDRAMAADLMGTVIQETRAHFHREEEAMEGAGYPGLEGHALEHERLLQEAADLLRQFNAGAISALAFPTFIKNWLIGHIRETDRKYAACLRQNGER